MCPRKWGKITLVGFGADLNGVDEYGVTPLMRAAQSNPNPEVIEALVRQGASLTVISSTGQTAYDWARESGNSEEILEILQLRPGD